MNLHSIFSILIFFFNLILIQADVDPKTILVEQSYLPTPEVGYEETQAALKNFQKRNKLPETGNNDAATRKLLSRPRCGKPKNAKIYMPKDQLWGKRNLTYQVFDIPKNYSKSLIIEIIDDAIAKWTRDLNLNIKQSKNNISDINIRFGKQDGRFNILGYALPPSNGGIYIDEEEDWNFEKKNSTFKVNFGWVAAHELGHSLGLSHEDDKDSIMYSFYSKEVFEPSSSDYEKLKHYYGVVPNNTEICKKEKIDGIVRIRKNHFLVFKNNQLWILTNGIEEGPFEISDYFAGLPLPIDCAFSIKNRIYFFKNKFFYKFYTDNETIKQKYISETFYKLPLNVDAAFYKANEKTIYFFRKNMFYKFDTKKPLKQRLSEAMRISERWNDIPDNVEAATLLENNVVLFVKKSKCYFFNIANNTTTTKNCRDYYKC